MANIAPDNGAKPDALRVDGLRVYYDTGRGPVKAVDGVSFSVKERERFGLVGESGSGKSSMALSIMRLIKPPGRIVDGSVWLGNRDLVTLNEHQMQRIRLAEIALIAQGSMNSLNPVLRIRAQIADGFRDHDVSMTGLQMEMRISELLERVGLQPHVAGMFPHELSGGMKQRVCTAIAITLKPTVIIADEPTSALDVVVQRQVMETLRAVQQDLGASVVLVGHDMGLMAQFVDRLGVMYAGRLVEISPVMSIFSTPHHPYTQMLIASLPSLEEKGEFQGIPGLPPSLLDVPPGCAFHPRCPQAIDRCQVDEPTMKEVQPNSWAACHLL